MQNKYRWFVKGNNSRVSNIKKWSIEISSDCKETLRTKMQLDDNEDCGLLFGSQISDNSIRINAISDSCRRTSSAKRCSCELDVQKANTLINEEYLKSNHTRFYIGEWHTHPEDNPTPSYRDNQSIKESYHKNQMVIPNLMIMAIVGRQSICWKMYDGVNIVDIQDS